MEKTNLREKKEYISDDGRRIECWTKLSEIPARKPENDDDHIENNPENKVFFGVMTIGTQVGPKDIKFNIPDAKTEEEAFAAYPKVAQDVIEQLQKEIEEARRHAMGEDIQIAPPGTLEQLDKLNDNRKSKIITV